LSIYSVILRGCLAYIFISCLGQLQWSWFAADVHPLYDAILYENAGRGTWGSLKWLWVHHVKQPLTAFGALLTIISLAIDPIVQQLIVPVNCMWQVPGINATLPRTNVFVSLKPFEDLDTVSAISVEFDKILPFGITSSGDDIVIQCPTGNCTFADTVDTLGFCSFCEDISNKLVLTHQCCQNSSKICITISDPASCSGPGTLRVVFVTNLPGSWNLSAYQLAKTVEYGPDGKVVIEKEGTMIVTDTTGVINPSWGISTDQINLGGMWYRGNDSSYPGVNIQIAFGNTLFSGTGINPVTGEQISGCDSVTATGGQHDWNCRGYGAANCTLRPCVRQYNDSVVNMRLSETLVAAVDLPLLLDLDAYETGMVIADFNLGKTFTEDLGSKTFTGFMNDMGAGDLTVPVILKDDYMEDIESFGVVDTQCATSVDLSQLAAQNNTILGPEPQFLNRWRWFWVSNETVTLLGDLMVRHCVYMMNYKFAGIVREQLLRLNNGITNLNATMEGGFFPITNHTAASNPWIAALGPTPTLRTFYGISDLYLLKYAYNYCNPSIARVDEIMANISEALTRVVRAHAVSSNYLAPAVGVVLNAETCVSVRWGWLAFPVAVTACGVAFLAAVATATARNHLPPWKESLLAWVFRGPQHQHQQHRRRGQPGPSLQSMERAAREVFVTLANADTADPHMVQTDGEQGGGPWAAGGSMQKMASGTEESLQRDSLDMGHMEVGRRSSVSPPDTHDDESTGVAEESRD
jgi:hypothetical protein